MMNGDFDSLNVFSIEVELLLVFGVLEVILNS